MKKNYFIVKILTLAMPLLFFLIYYKLLIGYEIFTHDSIVWCGRFHYYIENIVNGCLPFWDPYIISGTPFYPNINFAGLLSPLIIIPMFMVKILGINILSAFVYFQLFNLAIFIIGSFYLFRFITKCNISASVFALVLLFAVAPPFFRQSGTIEFALLTPFAIYFLLSFLDNIKNTSNLKYFYLFCFVLVFGISMNIGIPAYFLFNLFAFITTLFILKIIKLNELIKLAYDKKFLLFLFLSFFILFLMFAPLFALYKDSGINGEIFPSVRVLQKNNGQFKKIIASDINESVLSEKFTANLGVYNSYGNILNLIYPKMYKSYFGPSNFFTAFFTRNDYIAETFMYIGIIPLIFAIIGFIYSKSRYKYLASIMLVIIFINMFSFQGVHDRPPNFLQKFFNSIFPPLKMIEVREVFSTFFLLYLVILASLGFKLFFDSYSKFNVTGYLARLVPKLRNRLFYTLILVVIFIDLFVYNINMKQFVLQNNTLTFKKSELQKKHENLKFEYFRIPFLDTPIAFGESILKIKGAISRGNNHHMFTTKRYYDYLTHVPLENQFVLSGIVYPVIRFYCNDKVRVFHDRKSLLKMFTEEKAEVLTKYLFIEDNKDVISAVSTEKLKKLNMYENVTSLKENNIKNCYYNFLKKKLPELKKIRKNLNLYLNTPEYSIDVKEFTPNRVVIFLKNKINGYLYYNDGYSKYWKAYDGGKEIPIKIANYNFKAVFLENGEHTISFVYSPVHYRLSLIMYYSGILFFLILILFLYLNTYSL